MANDSGFSFRVEQNDLPRIARELPGILDKILRGVATDMVSDIKLSFGSSPASPGGPPGVDTGTLRASIKWKKQGKLSYIIHDGVLYGIMLEFATARRKYAFPFMRPVFEEWRQHKLIPAFKDIEAALR